MMRRFYLGTSSILALVVMIAVFVGKAGFEIAGRLLFGWWSYLARVMPQVSVSQDGMITGLGCLILFTVGLHFFLRWFHREIRQAGGPSDEKIRRWKPRWTASIVAVVVLMFVAGMGAAGLAHQVGWLMNSRRPHLIPRLEQAGGSVGQLKQIGLALNNYMFSNNVLPLLERDSQGRPLQSWQKQILAFIPWTSGGEIHDDLPWNDPRNSAYFRGVVLTYLNPEIGTVRNAEGYALSHYAGNVHVLGEQGRIPAGWKLELSASTILAGEVSANFKAWGDPTNLRDPALGINRSPEGFGGPSAGGANFLFLDGSVRFVKDSIDPKVLQDMSHPKLLRVP